ncbi:BrnT family toxin [Nocardia cyriacigeorgica]|nr:BrnT family toxin [Nocardia cyriacigeorgica]
MEVEEAAQRPYHFTKGREGTNLLLGRTYAGRYLLVVLSESEDGRWYVVTARDMTEPEQKAYERRAR